MADVIGREVRLEQCFNGDWTAIDRPLKIREMHLGVERPHVVAVGTPYSSLNVPTGYVCSLYDGQSGAFYRIHPADLAALKADLQEETR